MTTQELIDYYKSLLIMQYSSQPNALATMDAIIKRLVQDQIISKVRDGFDLDTAIGKQLEILGTYRGAERNVFGVTPGSYWSSPEYTDPNPDSYFGWAEYADDDPTWNWIQYADVDALLYALSDAQLRKLIKFRAQIQSWPGGLGELDDILFDFFGVYVNVVDNEDMSIVYEHTATDPDLDNLFDVAVLSNSLPAPAGVSFTTVEV